MTAFSLRRIVAALEDAGLLVSSSATLPATISGVSGDTRTLSAGDLFVAVAGTGSDGHRFLNQARDRGASAAIVERSGSSDLPEIVVRDSRIAAALSAATFYLQPADQMRMVGVTGTNGKTTTVSILRHLLAQKEKRAASIGTLGVIVAGGAGEASNGGEPDGPVLTTPGPIELQRLLHSLLESGVKSVAMEVSSHSLDQRRVSGISFDAAIFTNLSRDHIDYHGTMESYFSAKARLLDLLAEDAVVGINADDPAWRNLPKTRHRTIRFGVDDPNAEVRALNLSYVATGSTWTLASGEERHHVHLPLIGAFNVANALGAAAAVLGMGMSAGTVASLLSTSPQVMGRMERLHEDPVVLRDYAHTPDALERALLALKPFAPRGVLVVFGCGGDRDRGKRPQMGGIAARLADKVIITSDNPRTENPESILDEIAAGMKGHRFERIEDRRAAIQRAIEIASDSGELVLLAGKGHETYQIRGKERLHFDEKEVVAEIVRGRTVA